MIVFIINNLFTSYLKHSGSGTMCPKPPTGVWFQNGSDIWIKGAINQGKNFLPWLNTPDKYHITGCVGIPCGFTLQFVLQSKITRGRPTGSSVHNRLTIGIYCHLRSWKDCPPCWIFIDNVAVLFEFNCLITHL